MIITDFLPEKNTLNTTDTPLRDFLNDTIGAFFDEFIMNTDEMNTGLFIQNATGEYLDLYGRDYDVPRLVGESDEHYRNRLIVISSKHFTVNTLYNEYDLQLLSYTNSTVTSETLLSDNHYVTNKYFIDCDDVTWDTLTGKYVSGLVRLE